MLFFCQKNNYFILLCVSGRWVVCAIRSRRFFCRGWPGRAGRQRRARWPQKIFGPKNNPFFISAILPLSPVARARRKRGFFINPKRVPFYTFKRLRLSFYTVGNHFRSLCEIQKILFSFSSDIELDFPFYIIFGLTHLLFLIHGWRNMEWWK